MDHKAHEELLRATTRLRTLLADAKTETVVGWCVASNVKRTHEPDSPRDLASPARQQAFLLALLLSTPEPPEPRGFTEEDWEKATRILDSIFTAYQSVMWPPPEQLGRLSQEWLRVREVAGQALLHYHNTGLLATVDQLE